MLLRIHRIKFIDLNKRKTLHIGPLGAFDPIFMKHRLYFFRLPPLDDAAHPLDKMFRCFARGEGNNASRVFQNPFDEPESESFPRRGKLSTSRTSIFSVGEYRSFLPIFASLRFQQKMSHHTPYAVSVPFFSSLRFAGCSLPIVTTTS